MARNSYKKLTRGDLMSYISVHDLSVLGQNSGIQNFSFELEPSNFYQLEGLEDEHVSLVDLYLQGKIGKSEGYTIYKNSFTYQSDLTLFNSKHKINSLAQYLAMEREGYDHQKDLFKFKVIKDLGLSAEIYSKASLLTPTGFNAFLLASFLFQSRGVILITIFSPKTAMEEYYFNEFVRKTDCAVIFTAAELRKPIVSASKPIKILSYGK